MLDLALAQLPEHARPTPSSLQDQGGPQILIRADSAGTTRAFLAGCRQRGVRYSVGLAVDQRIQDAITLVPADACQPAISTDGTVRDNGEIVELTELLDLSAWPAGSRVICRRERPHAGAQYRFTDIDGHRFQGLLTDTAGRGNDIAALELRHRQHARVEDRIRNGKDRGMRNLPCKDWHTNAAWLELTLAAADLTTCAQALCFTGALRKLEPKASALPRPAHRGSARPHRTAPDPAPGSGLALGHRPRPSLQPAPRRTLARLTNTTPASPRPGRRRTTHPAPSRALNTPAAKPPPRTPPRSR